MTKTEETHSRRDIPTRATEGQRFPPTLRLRKRWQFRLVQRSGARVHTPHFVIMVLNSPVDHPRLGITVTKKVAPSAVKRNRIKRLVREVFRRNRGRFPAAELVLVAKRGAEKLRYADVERELAGVAQRTHRVLGAKTRGLHAKTGGLQVNTFGRGSSRKREADR